MWTYVIISVAALAARTSASTTTPPTTQRPAATTTQQTGNTTTPSVIPPLPNYGIAMTVYDTWGWSDDPAQMRHLLGFPGVTDNLEASDSTAISFTDPSIHLLSLDLDYNTSNVFMYDYHFGIIVIGANYSTRMNTSELEFKIMHHVMTSGQIQVAYDWLSKTLYWCDSSVRMIMAANAQWSKVDEDNYKIIADDHLSGPTGIAVDPFEAYVFWSDVGPGGQFPKIERASMDGTNRHTIIHDNLKAPAALECDLSTRRLYWIDSWTESIVYANYDGSDRQFVVRLSSGLLFDLVIYKNFMYVSDIGEDSIFTMDKLTGAKKADDISYYDIDETIYGIAIYSNETQQFKDKDFCAIKNCSHMCVSTKYDAECLCGEGYQLNRDTNTCEEDQGNFHKAFVYANVSHICLLDIRSLTSTGFFEPFCILSMVKERPIPTTAQPVRRRRQAENTTTGAPVTNAPTTKAPTTQQNQTQAKTTAKPTTAPPTTPPTTTPVPTTTLPPPTVAPGDSIKMIEVDNVDRRVFFVTQDNSIYMRSIDAPIENDSKEKLTIGDSAVTGLAYDPEDRNLYWTQDNGRIHRIHTDNNRDVTEVTTDTLNFVHPKDIIILYHLRKLAFIAGNDGEMGVYTLDMDGTNNKTLTQKYDAISSLIFDKELNLFYCLVTGKGRIVSIPLAGIEEPDLVTSAPNIAAYILLEYHQYFVWVYSSGDYPNIVMSVERKYPSSPIGHYFYDNVSTIVDLKILDAKYQITEPGLCSVNNGGCAHMCVTKLQNGAPAKVCQCKKGWKLANDKMNCTSTPVRDNFILISDWTNDELIQIELDTNKLVAIPAKEDYYYEGLHFDPDTMRIWWSLYYDSVIYSSELDGSDVKLEADLRYSFPHRFMKDSSTGNMYYITYFYQAIGVVTASGHDLRLFEDFFYENLNAIEIHPGKGYLYFAVSGYYESYVARSFMDGTNVTRIIDGYPAVDPDGLAIDYIHDHLYIGDYEEDTILRCNLDGQDCITIINSTDQQIRDIVTDGTYLYYTAYKQDHIVRVLLEPPFTQTKIGANAGLGKVNTISFYSSSNQNKQPVKNACSANNGLGDCSTICLPTPKGRTCACDTGIELEADGRTCSDVHLCTDVILFNNTATQETDLSITFDTSCLRRENSTCTFKCPVNYVPKNKSLTTVTCKLSGWDGENHELCEELRCPQTFEHGSVGSSDKCTRNVGSVCDFQCETGFMKAQPTIFCKNDGLWHGLNGGLCIPHQCSDTITQKNPRTNEPIAITFPQTCDYKKDSSCQYKCPHGYVPSDTTKPTLTCSLDGWDRQQTQLCAELTCPKTIDNGNVGECPNYVGSSCADFTCKSGFVKSQKEIFCKANGQWHGSEPAICEPYKCPEEISHGMLEIPCDRTVGSQCRYKCDKYYDFAQSQKQDLVLTCGTKGWSLNTSTLCTDAACPDSSLTNGKVDADCIKTIGHSCKYKCNHAFANSTVEVVCKQDQVWHPRDACGTMYCPQQMGQASVDPRTCSREVGSVCQYKCANDFKANTFHPNISCLPTGLWNKTKDLCFENMKSPLGQTSAATASAGLIAGLVVLGLVILVLVVLSVFLCKRRRASLAYATASFKNGGNVAIENPGYLETRMSDLQHTDEHPYSSVDPRQMQPVQFPDDKSDGGLQNPMYGNEALAEVAHVEVNQDKAVLTYDSWLKEQQAKGQ